MKMIRTLHPAWIAGIIAIAVTVWVMTGVVDSPEKPSTAEQTAAEPEAPKVIKVKVRPSEGTPIIREAIISGKTAPVRSVRVKAETSGRIAEVVARRGDLISRNGVIARIALNERQAQKRQAEAVLQQRKLQFEAAQRLRRDDYMTEVDLAQAKANLEIAQADVDRINQDISHTVIRSPFAGVLEERTVEVGDYVNVGDEIGYIIDQSAFIVTGSVPEDVVAFLEVGQSGTTVLVDKRMLEGRLRYIASAADEQTRTYKVELEVPNESKRFISGASANLRLPMEEVVAHELEPSILSLNEKGEFGIKTVDENNRVQFYIADIVRNRDGKIWLTSLPENIRVITVGQGFVSTGDKVEVELDRIEPDTTGTPTS